jgi:Phage-related minor tail protein
MDNTQERILSINVRYDDAIRGIAKYRSALDELRLNEKNAKEDVDKGRISREKYNLYMADSKIKVQEATEGIRTLTKVIQNNHKAEREQEGSLKSLRAQLSNLTSDYDSLSQKEREAASGKKLRDKINEITESIKDAEEETGRFYRNVGNYKESLKGFLGMNNAFASSLLDIADNGNGLKGFFSSIDTQVKAFGQSLLGLLSNPVFAAIAGIAGVATAFKFWYDYNKGLVEATKLTQQFTGKNGEDLKQYRNEVQAVADTFGKDFKETLIAANTVAKQFGITQEESLNLIKDGFVAGADANGEFLDNLKEYPAYFKEAGISADQFIAITTQANKNGIFSDKGIDAIKEANLRIREMTTATATALNGIGISSKKVQADLKSGATTTFEVMQEVSEKLNQLPQSSSAVGSAIADIFGGPGEDAGLKYLQTLKDIDTNLSTVKSGAGELGRLQEEQLESQLKLQNALSSLFDMTGGDFEQMTTRAKIFVNDGLVSIIQGIQEAVNWFKELYNGSQNVRAGISAMSFAFQTLFQLLKALFGFALENFKLLGNIIKSALTLDLSGLESGIKQWAVQIKNITKETINTVYGAAKEAVNNAQNGKLQVGTPNNGSKETGTNQTSGTVSKTSSSIKTNAQIKEAIEAKKKELQEVRKAEDEMLKIVKDNREKQTKEINYQYDRQIEDLKQRLLTEKNLTPKARVEIDKQIKALAQQKKDALKKLSDEQLTKDIANRQKLIETELAGVKAGSDEEYQLKMQQLETQRQAELSNKELTEEMKLAITRKYNKLFDDLVTQHENDTIQKQADMLAKRFAQEAQLLKSHNDNKLQELDNMGASESQQRQAQNTFTLQELETSLSQQNESLDNMKRKEDETDEDYNKRRLEKKQQIADTEVQIETVKVKSQQDLYNDFRDAIDALGEHNKSFAILSKALALGEIAINTGKAVAAGIAQAQSVPFPGNIAAIATTITTIMTNIATAIKTVKSAKFAEGGAVTGPGTATSDSIPAMLSNGESVLTASATSMFSPILSAFNQMGGGIPINVTTTSNQAVGEEMLARAVAKGMMMAPAPVVSVEEYTSVANRVKYLEDLGNV